MILEISCNIFYLCRLFFCIENKSDYELYKKKNLELKRNKKGKIDGEIPYYVDKNEKGNELGINIYDNLITRDNFVFIFILYEKKKNKYHMFFKVIIFYSISTHIYHCLIYK